MNRLKGSRSHLRLPVKHKKLFRKKPNPVVLKKLAIAFAISLIAAFVYMKAYPHTFEAKQVQQLQTTVQQLKNLEKQQEQLKTKNKQEDADKAKKIEELNKKLQDTQKQLQAKKSTATVYAAELPVSYPISANAAKAYIYSHESGNNPNSVNSIGCRGLGQACPGTKLPCGNDYACQDAYFTQYMKDRYGSWEAAYNFWIANNWW